jgi:hypothetical protein
MKCYFCGEDKKPRAEIIIYHDVKLTDKRGKRYRETAEILYVCDECFQRKLLKGVKGG